VGQLTGGVAHDFNNLLTVVIGALDLMQRNPDDPERRERMLTAALGAARRGERLTQQLLAFARRQALKPELVSVDHLLLDSEALLRRAVGEAVALTVAPTATRAMANVDPSQFEAAVMNLVVNARDATPRGGSIRVESLCCEVAAGEVEELAGGEYICVAVHDTGEGMGPETTARVFEPFFTTKEPGRGTGLGLSQVYGFARQSGGAATVESAPGKGTSVRLYLPLVAGPMNAAAAAGPAAARKPGGPRLCVLLVEDDPEVGAMVQAMLEDLDHRVRRVDGVAAAMAILETSEPVHLLLTDIVMPGDKTGVDLAHAATQLRPRLPVILSSGYTGETLKAATEAPWPLLPKPYDAEELARVIAAAIRSKADAL
jgi:CheY-like chemotaxis protein